MNVLEAVRQLDKYIETISALKLGAEYVSSHYDSYRGELIIEVMKEYQKKADNLNEQLEKTSLVTLRGIDL